MGGPHEVSAGGHHEGPGLDEVGAARRAFGVMTRVQPPPWAEKGPWPGDDRQDPTAPWPLAEEGTGMESAEHDHRAPAARRRAEPLPFRSLRDRLSDFVTGHGPLLDPGRPGLRVIVLLGVLAALVGAVYAWRSRPLAEPVGPPLPVAGSPLPPSPSSPATASAGRLPAAGASSASAVAGTAVSPGPQVIVHVTGKVGKPGIVTLPIGSRVADAVTAAGGVRAGGTGGLNLARRLVDGEQIVVGAPGGPSPGGQGPSAGAPAGTPEVLDLNAATPAQLETLPGIGEVLATRIVEYRQTHAGFRSVAQLREVTGIGERKFAGLRDKVRA